MNSEIRLMSAADLPAIEDIQAQAYAGYFLESSEVIAQRFAVSPNTAWVALYNGQVCAYLVGYWSTLGTISQLNAPFRPLQMADCFYLHDLALAKTAQGKGVAKRLIHTATDYVRQNSASVMALLSVQDSKAFWQALGFAEYAVLEPNQQQNLYSYCLANETATYMVRRL